MKLLKSRPKELKGLKPSLVKEDKEYKYSKIEFFIKNKNLYIKLSGYKVKTKWFVLENYSKYTALEVINMVSWGRHFEDGILLLWENEGLRFGWLENYIFYLGKKGSQGFGQVGKWEFKEIEEDWSIWKDGKLMRPIPAEECKEKIGEMMMKQIPIYARQHPILPPYWRKETELCLMPEGM